MSGLMIGSYEVKNEALKEHVNAVNALSSDEMLILQALPLDEVANELGYTGSLEKFEFPEETKRRPLSISNDAVKLVCLYKNYNPSEARCFLIDRLSTQFSVLREEFNLIKEKITDQMNYLGGYYDTHFKIYRRIPINDSTPKVSKDDMYRGYSIKEIGPQYAVDYSFSPAEVSARLCRMFCYSRSGENIVIKPVSDRYRFIVLRSVSDDNFEKMKSNGYGPNFVMRESWEHYSVVFVVPAFYYDDIFKAIAKDLAEEFEAIVDDSVFVVGTHNFATYTERRGKYPIVEIEGTASTEISDVMRNFIRRIMKRRFDSIQKIKNDFKETKGMVQDKDIGEVLYLGKGDSYYSPEEIKSLIAGNGEHADGGFVYRNHFTKNVFSHLQTFKKKFSPIVDSPLFSDPRPLISFEEDDEIVEEHNYEESTHDHENETEGESPETQSEKPKTLWGRIFK